MIMIMTRDHYEDAHPAFTHPLQHRPFEPYATRDAGPRPLRPLKRARTPPRTPKVPCVALPIPSPSPPRNPPSVALALSTSLPNPSPSPASGPAPLASPRSPFLPTGLSELSDTTCPHCGLAYPNPEIDAYTPDELEQLDFLHALGNWAWDDKCSQKLVRLRAPFERLHRQRPTFAEAIGAAARVGMNNYASQLVACMDEQQCRINENLNSLKLQIVCNLSGHDGDRASESWEHWLRQRTRWDSDQLRDMNATSTNNPAALALELFRDVLRDLGEDEVGNVPVSFERRHSG